jgi:hypothetical protein
MNVDFESLRKVREPTRREAANYRNWVRYLSDSKLTSDEIHSRAAAYAAQGKKAPRG